METSFYPFILFNFNFQFCLETFQPNRRSSFLAEKLPIPLHLAARLFLALALSLARSLFDWSRYNFYHHVSNGIGTHTAPTFHFSPSTLVVKRLNWYHYVAWPLSPAVSSSSYSPKYNRFHQFIPWAIIVAQQTFSKHCRRPTPIRKLNSVELSGCYLFYQEAAIHLLHKSALASFERNALQTTGATRC